MSYFTQLLTAQAHSLRLPTGIKERAERFVRQGSSGATPERLPFRRMLDFWAVAIGYAIATEQAIAPFSEAKSGKKFIDTRAVDLPDALCDFLAVIAFTELCPDHEDLDSPGAVIDVGNMYAAAGVDPLLRELENPAIKLSTLERLLDFVAQAIPRASGSREPVTIPPELHVSSRSWASKAERSGRSLAELAPEARAASGVAPPVDARLRPGSTET